MLSLFNEETFCGLLFITAYIYLYIFFRSRLADFLSNCQPEARSISGCLKENYADCLLAYSGLIGKLRTFTVSYPLQKCIVALQYYGAVMVSYGNTISFF